MKASKGKVYSLVINDLFDDIVPDQSSAKVQCYAVCSLSVWVMVGWVTLAICFLKDSVLMHVYFHVHLCI